MRLIFAMVCGLALLAARPSLACGGEGLGQVWSTPAQNLWYASSTGSRLIPDAWYRALPRADDGKPFAARDSIARYGFVFCDPKAKDPVGFVLDRDATRTPALGLNCAACHTGRL